MKTGIWVAALQTHYIEVYFTEIELTHGYIERSLNYLRDRLDNWQRYENSLKYFPPKHVVVWTHGAKLKIEGGNT